MSLDPVSMVFEAIGEALNLYEKLSEQDKQKVRDGLVAQRAQLAADRGDLQATVDQVKAERDAVLAELQSAHQPIIDHPDTPAPVADQLRAIGAAIAARFSAPLPAPQIVNTKQGE